MLNSEGSLGLGGLGLGGDLLYNNNNNFFTIVMSHRAIHLTIINIVSIILS